MGKINMGFFYGKLYNSCTRTFSIRTGEKFIDETGQYVYAIWAFIYITRRKLTNEDLSILLAT